MHKYLIPLAATAAFVGASSVFAAQTNDSFQSRITIQTSCLVIASSVDFGNVGVINGTETASGSVNVNCSAGTPWALSFSSTSSVVTIASAMTNVNGEDVAYSAALSGTSGTGPATLSILAALPSQVTPLPAIYTDNQVVYVNY